MKNPDQLHSPRRITDLIRQQEMGCTVTCHPAFEILPVNFLHRENPYKAYIFLCRFNGEIDGTPYSFRKCYARGCPENHCSHVSRAIMTANRYLQRDYSRLEKAEIKVDQRLFTLEGMLVKYDGYQQEHDNALTMEESILLSKDGVNVDLNVELEYVPAVEHFSNYENSQTFLTAEFTVTFAEKKYAFHLCLS